MSVLYSITSILMLNGIQNTAHSSAEIIVHGVLLCDDVDVKNDVFNNGIYD